MTVSQQRRSKLKIRPTVFNLYHSQRFGLFRRGCKQTHISCPEHLFRSNESQDGLCGLSEAVGRLAPLYLSLACAVPICIVRNRTHVSNDVHACCAENVSSQQIARLSWQCVWTQQIWLPLSAISTSSGPLFHCQRFLRLQDLSSTVRDSYIFRTFRPLSEISPSSGPIFHCQRLLNLQDLSSIVRDSYIFGTFLPLSEIPTSSGPFFHCQRFLHLNDFFSIASDSYIFRTFLPLSAIPTSSEPSLDGQSSTTFCHSSSTSDILHLRSQLNS